MKHRSAKEGYSNQISRDGGRTGTAGTEDEGKRARRTWAAYLRKMALDGYILRLDLPELKEILSQLRYMGNNVNQIAKRANEVGVIDEMDIRGVSKRQERMLEQMARLLEKLSGLN